jgi:hypothetical protein
VLATAALVRCDRVVAPGRAGSTWDIAGSRGALASLLM